jgi:hypothetical protein
VKDSILGKILFLEMNNTTFIVCSISTSDIVRHPLFITVAYFLSLFVCFLPCAYYSGMKFAREKREKAIVQTHSQFTDEDDEHVELEATI